MSLDPPHVNGMIFVRRLDSWDPLTFHPLINVEEGRAIVCQVLRCTRPCIVCSSTHDRFSFDPSLRLAKKNRNERSEIMLLLRLTNRSLTLRNNVLYTYRSTSIGISFHFSTMD